MICLGLLCSEDGQCYSLENHSPVDSLVCLVNTYPLDKD